MQFGQGSFVHSFTKEELYRFAALADKPLRIAKIP